VARADFELHGKCLFLDFDGTLVDIAPTPETIQVSPALPRRLAALQEAMDGAVAIVTGRDVADIENFLPEFTGPIAGGHGSHMRGTDGQYVAGAFDGERLQTIKRDIATYARAIDGLRVENKTAGCVLHYRQVPHAGEDAHRFVKTLLRDHPGFTAEAAKMAVEVRPEAIDKAGAVAELSTLPSFGNRLPVFAGDDISDEPAFRWVNAQGGTSIRIGNGPTSAQYCVSSVRHFAAWIDSALAALTNGNTRKGNQ
jgi:trehalose 6-phosphate phosphatase